jgi:HPt (histidine-containing phosphotransfer) domain-containing protein
MNDTLQNIPVPPPLPPTDPLEGEPELRQELAWVFLEDYEFQLAKIHQAIVSHEAAELRKAAHTLKGSTGVFRDQQAFDAAFHMEFIGRDAAWERAEGAWEILQAETLRLADDLRKFVARDAMSEALSEIVL